MKASVLNRRIHYWAGFVVSLPMLVLIGSGLLLQSKKHWGWVQPPERRGTGISPILDLEGILASVKSVPEMDVSSWDDVNRLDVRPGEGSPRFGSTTDTRCRSIPERWSNAGR